MIRLIIQRHVSSLGATMNSNPWARLAIALAVVLTLTLVTHAQVNQHIGDAASGSSCFDDPPASAHSAAHSGLVKSSEHTAVMKLVPACEATHIAVQSGPWSDP